MLQAEPICIARAVAERFAIDGYGFGERLARWSRFCGCAASVRT
jgi:hypothetical protein